jgi:hypothetical protein
VRSLWSAVGLKLKTPHVVSRSLWRYEPAGSRILILVNYRLTRFTGTIYRLTGMFLHDGLHLRFVRRPRDILSCTAQRNGTRLPAGVESYCAMH